MTARVAYSRRKEFVSAGDVSMSEGDYQQRIMDTAKLLNWRIVHIRPMWDRTGKRMMTPYTGHPGLPDLILARRGTVLLIEVKSETGKPSLDQEAWLAAAGPNGFLTHPSDWPHLLKVLESR